MDEEKSESSEEARNSDGKIVLPKELQIKMLEFFMRTSIPRKMREDKKAEAEKGQTST